VSTDLVNLESMYIFDNVSTGRLPSTLGSLSQLADLSFSEYLLSGQGEASTDFAGNDLTGQLPSTFESLSQLADLRFSRNLL
jgi:hypothetical protein